MLEEIKTLLRSNISFSIDEKIRILDELPSKSEEEHEKFLDILTRAAQEMTILKINHPERIPADVARAEAEWDSHFDDSL